MFYVTQAGTGNSLTPVVVGTYHTLEDATKAADTAYQEMLTQVDEAYPDGNGSLPDVFGVWSAEQYQATHGEVSATVEYCCSNLATEPHTCPYKSDVDNDNETLCTCCAHCEHECAMDI